MTPQFESTARVGFFTDTTLCIGCKACEVACKEWNRVPDDGFNFLGQSYDNTGELGADTWRHVAFIEKKNDGEMQWLMLASVSAPSTLAVELAEEAGMTLIGFLRGPTMNVYTGEHRVST